MSGRQTHPAADLLTAHLAEMREFKAAFKSLRLGPKWSPRLHLAFKLTRGGGVIILNRLTGTTAHEHDRAGRAALIAECGPWLKHLELRMAWHLSQPGPARVRAAKAFFRFFEQQQQLPPDGAGSVA